MQGRMLSRRMLQVVPPFSKKYIVFDGLPSWLLIDSDGKPITRSENCPADIIGLAIGVSLCATEVATHHTIFTLSNLVACMIAADILQLVGVRSFRTAVVLLAGACSCKAAPCRT
jgi:hypothetical protein